MPASTSAMSRVLRALFWTTMSLAAMTSFTDKALAQTSAGLGAGAQGAQTTMSQVRGWFSGQGDPVTNFFMNYVFGPLFPGQNASPMITKAIFIVNMASIGVAAIFAIYQIVQGVTQTAHTGRLLGEQHSFWGPVRLAVAAFLLIPIPSKAYYNSGQLIVAWLVKGGSVAASTLWTAGVSTLMANNNTISAQTIQTFPAGNLPPSVINSMWNMSACQTGMNILYNQVNSGKISADPGLFDASGTMLGSDWLKTYDVTPMASFISVDGWNGATGEQLYQSANAETLNATLSSAIGQRGDAVITMAAPAKSTAAATTAALLGVCGEVSSPPVPSALTNTSAAGEYQSAWSTAMAGLKQSLDTSAKTILLAQMQSSGSDASKFLANTNFGAMANQANSTLASSLRQIASTWASNNPILPSDAQTACAATGASGSSGLASTEVKNCYPLSWLSAGAYYIRLANIYAKFNEILSPSATVIHDTSWGSYVQSLTSSSMRSGSSSTKDIYERMASAADNAWSAYGLGGGVSALGPTNQAATGDKARNSPKLGATEGSSFTLEKIGLSAASIQGLYHALSGQDVGSDPLQGLVAFGQGLARIAVIAFAAVAAGSIFLSGVGIVGMPIIGVMMAVGYFLGFMIPLMPFVVWSIASVSYFVIVAEALVAVNLWAIAHMRFAGEGIAGAAQAGYQILLALCLTPLLMVMGLFAGMLIVWVGGTMINLAISTIWALGPSGAVESVIYLIAMALVLGYLFWMLIEKGFFLVGEFPSRIFRWIGHSESPLTRGEEAQIRQGALAAGYATGRLTQTVGVNVPKGVGHVARGLTNRLRGNSASSN